MEGDGLDERVFAMVRPIRDHGGDLDGSIRQSAAHVVKLDDRVRRRI
jgi:hypothetical protein